MLVVLVDLTKLCNAPNSFNFTFPRSEDFSFENRFLSTMFRDKKRLISDVDTYSFCIDIIFGRSLGDIRLYVPLTFLSSCCHEARILKGIVASPRLIEPLIGLFCVLAEGSSQLHWKSQWLSYCDHQYRVGIFQIIAYK